MPSVAGLLDGGAPSAAAAAPPDKEVTPRARLLLLLAGDGLQQMVVALKSVPQLRTASQEERIAKLARCVRFFLTLDESTARQVCERPLHEVFACGVGGVYRVLVAGFLLLVFAYPRLLIFPGHRAPDLTHLFLH